MADSSPDLVYVDEDVGKDEVSQPGTEDSPYKSLDFAHFQKKLGAHDQYRVRKSLTGDVPEGSDASVRLQWQPAPKAGYKKAVKNAQILEKKAAREQELELRRKKEEDERQLILDEAKKVVLTEDSSLPKPIKMKLNEKDPVRFKPRSATAGEGEKGVRVKVVGRVHSLRAQKDNIFITLRDGYGFLQVLLSGQLTKTYDAMTLTRETSMEIYGELREPPAGNHAIDNRELHADFYVIRAGWKAAGGDDAITNRVQAKADPSQLLNLRHLKLRETPDVLIVRDAVEGAFHQFYRERQIRKVSPPALVQTQVEGGSTLFHFDYYGEEAYLTQSSQLYLETCLPFMGDVYCIEKSFRAEKSLTRRHLSEYTHIEGELDFITFDDLLEHLEDLICRVIELVLADADTAERIKKMNPDFQPPERPFMRMRYADAIEWLREHNILTDEGKPHEFGDDIAEAAERKMTDDINRPIFLTHFPVEIKAFYMEKDPNDRRVTESVDVLMPNVGEIVGGSMRMQDYDELMEAYKRSGIGPEPYYWYTDQRK
jgi:asparaginyl-tRNA synthetase